MTGRRRRKLRTALGAGLRRIGRAARRVRLRDLRPRSRRSAGWLAVALLAVLWWTNSGASHAGERPTWAQRDILDAIQWVESRGREDVPDGDGGDAIGPYQIHRGYWLDAHSYDRTLGGTYQDCRRRAYAERVVTAYMRRYAAEAWQRGDAETIARIHNGGPRGHEKRATDRYWERVEARLPEPR